MDYAAQNLHALRKAHGMSKRELAELVTERGGTMYTTTVTRLENGQSQMKLSDAVTFSEILGVSLDRFATQPIEDTRSAKALKLRNEAQKQESKVFKEVRTYLATMDELHGEALANRDATELRKHLKDRFGAELGDPVETVTLSACIDWFKMDSRQAWVSELRQASRLYGEFEAEAGDMK